MTREVAKEMLPIIQAFAEGKQIEYSNDGENWFETTTPTWDTDFVYRIKPEPKYRPFRTQEECWNEMHKHPDLGWVKCVYTDEIVHINSISSPNIPLCFKLSNASMNYTSDLVFKDYSFTDDKPFGIKEEEL